MTRKLVYQDADGEKVTLPNVKEVKSIGNFFYVEYKPFMSSSIKETNIREDRVIRYDSN